MEFQAANPILMPRHSVRTFFGSDIDSDGRIVFNLLSQLHAAMLLTMSFDQIRRFWESLPLERNGVLLEGLPKYHLVLKESSKVPLAFQLQMMESVEPFCRKEGVDFELLKKNFFTGIYRWRHLSSKAMLGMVEPLLDGLFEAKDRRAFLYQNFEKLQTPFYPHSTHELVDDREEDGMRITTLLYSLDNSTNQHFNYKLWLLPWLQYLPEVFALPAAESAEMIADVRSIHHLLRYEDYRRRGDRLVCAGITVGRSILFSEFLKERKLPDSQLFDLKQECCLVEEDLYDKNDQLLLQKGCCYCAPAYLIELKYKARQKGKDNPLRPLLYSLAREDDLVLAKLNDLNEAFFNELAYTAKIVFYRKDDSISIDGEHFIRNVPAKIFRKVIRAYLLEKRTEFDNREFKRDAEITLDLVNPNFEGRLNRLMAKLSSTRPDLQIVRHQRGSFRFSPKCAIDYREE